MQDSLKNGVSRRTVVAGAAWTVPAIVVASAAPAMAATPIVTIGVGLACKHPGNPKHYHFNLTVKNNGGTTTTVTITSIVLIPTSGQNVTFSTLPAPFDVAAHSSVCVVVDSDLTANSANGTLKVGYDYTDSNGQTQHFDAAIDVSSIPPCQQIGVPDYPHPNYSC
ncbi:hypothetical protein N865_08985 [Intrasporangium oryzae NRRL B-24470]|uniref:Tat pathway signal sequence domain protein n=1 Tax=Intrasporangium oryzae NRRL B-24470 TaxID=1386089 RepID=W9GBU7_9MICO|nr:hypothetical protein [Intrasporangium oryzae]EWT03686.1 hypothetical protein N865_08985 [Intrasporangium oryzae NRRL B-24470]